MKFELQVTDKASDARTGMLNAKRGSPPNHTTFKVLAALCLFTKEITSSSTWQHPVDKAVVGKQRLEDHGVGNQRGCTRQEDHGAVDALALQIGAVEQLRQNQRQNQHDGHLDHKVKYRVEQALLEGGVL